MELSTVLGQFQSSESTLNGPEFIGDVDLHCGLYEGDCFNGEYLKLKTLFESETESTGSASKLSAIHAYNGGCTVGAWQTIVLVAVIGGKRCCFTF